MSIRTNDIDRKLNEESKETVEKYSINLMWINKTLVSQQKYINQSETSGDLENYFLKPALKWALANPTAEVNIWYDSVHTSAEALARTKEVLASICKDEYKNLSLHFKDVRTIPIVMDNPDVFSDYLPVYFRVDILKAIIAVDQIERGKKDAAIFSDLEVGNLRPKCDRMNKMELFGSAEDTA